MGKCPKCNSNIVSIITKDTGDFAAVCEDCGHIYKDLVSRKEIMIWLQQHCEVKGYGEVTDPMKGRGMFGSKGYGVVTNPNPKKEEGDDS